MKKQRKSWAFLALLMATAAFLWAHAAIGGDMPGSYFFGNGDCNEYLSPGDLTAMDGVLSGSPPSFTGCHPADESILDLDGSGTVDALDLVILSKWVSGEHKWADTSNMFEYASTYGLPHSIELGALSSPAVAVGGTIRLPVQVLSSPEVYGGQARPRAGWGVVYEVENPVCSGATVVTLYGRSVTSGDNSGSYNRVYDYTSAVDGPDDYDGGTVSVVLEIPNDSSCLFKEVRVSVRIPADSEFSTPGKRFTEQLDATEEFSVETEEFSVIVGGNVIYVSADCTGTCNGTSWADGYTVIQDAVDAASSNDLIFVKIGTYTVDGGTDPDDLVLTMADNVHMYGGFVGTETHLGERKNPLIQRTILDGEDIRYHVVRGASNAILDGFFITNGNADGDNAFKQRGAGMLAVSETNFHVKNCIFSGNYAANIGAAVYLSSGSTIVIDHCIFSDNEAGTNGGAIYNTGSSGVTISNSRFSYKSFVYGQSWSNKAGGDGGAIYTTGGTPPEIVNCEFIENEAGDDGGAVYAYDGNTLVISHSIFRDNIAAGDGGAMYVSRNDLLLTNGLFDANIATYYGGAIEHTSGAVAYYYADIINSTFSGNGASAYGCAIDQKLYSVVSIRNSILWDTSCSGEVHKYVGAQCSINNSDVNDGCPTGCSCTSVLDTDPDFDQGICYPDGFYLTQSGNSLINGGDASASSLGLDDRTTSAECDAGQPTCPLDSATVDMGYHYDTDKCGGDCDVWP